MFIKCKTYRELSERTVKILSDEIKSVLSEKKTVLMAIPGGSSIRGVLEELPLVVDIPWEKIKLFMVDERCKDINDPLSNYYQAKSIFIDKVEGITAYPFFYRKKAANYNQLLRQESRGKMHFDIVLVASGEDGHIAGLFPFHHSIYHEGKEYFCYNDSPLPPEERITASKRMISGSSVVILLFAFSGRHEAFRKFTDSRLFHAECPAKIVNDSKKKYIIHPFQNENH